LSETNHQVAPSLLHYRPWRGGLRSAALSVWPIARTAVRQVFGRRTFWVLYGLGLMTFCLFFFGQYLLAWAETQAGSSNVRVGGLGRANPRDLVAILRDLLKLNGSGETFRNFMWYQGYVTVVVLALAGSILIGNDLRFGSLAFYLSKPVGPRHYLLGKGFAIVVLVNMMTTLPALALFVQYGLLDSWSYFRDRAHLCLGILGYGAVLSATLTLVLLATASWLRRTVPLVMAWTALFVFARALTRDLVDYLKLDPRWRLLDLWNDTYVVGCACLRVAGPDGSPSWRLAAMVLAVVCLACLLYLTRRIRAVEIVR
jgi:hypothetical protein